MESSCSHGPVQETAEADRPRPRPLGSAQVAQTRQTFNIFACLILCVKLAHGIFLYLIPSSTSCIIWIYARTHTSRTHTTHSHHPKRNLDPTTYTKRTHTIKKYPKSSDFERDEDVILTT
jgi:hypothetical protein